ncbi:uncharacterized protein LOC133390557 isoform X2 [Rhineura floridana]|uniref:uncharacterized protein LOC133390557 isoform X2 n=1 Tax=Rhineura floridana TaxID=261503 RepID=UPI002AC7EB4F|nr:uncharacterized protein LOC133390557 isoform X2 [Rhineura floridana]
MLPRRTLKALRYCLLLLLMVILPALPAYDVPNVALTREALQSSTYNLLGVASNAIDGSTSGEFAGGSCTHTDFESNPWWIVDLEAEYQVFRVSISNREDCCEYRLNGAEIRIGNSTERGGTTNPRCATIMALGSGETHSFYCEDSKGRYVTVTLPRAEYLTLCEVQVFGQKIDSTTEFEPEHSKPSKSQWELEHGEQSQMSAFNVALKGKAFQSSIYNALGNPENAIDGSTSADFLRGQCTQTELEINPWWTVDLTAEFRVFRVSITNRGDCCAKRINGAQIRIGNSPEKGGIMNPRCATISSLKGGQTGTFDCGEMQGQYVTITTPGIRILSLCEVQVFGVKVSSSGDFSNANETETSPGMTKEAEVSSPIEQWVKPRKPTQPWEEKKGQWEVYSTVYNAALDGKAFQSSSYNKLGSAKNAIDGSTSSDYLRGQCTHTQKEANPWWTVDLRMRFVVVSVVITNRGDCCAERINGAEIRIGDSEDEGGITNPRCATITSLHLGETQKFHCEGMSGQYVTITVPGEAKYLSLCEVQVFGHRKMPSVPNVALEGEAFQSSTYNKLGSAENAIDGSTSVDFMHRTCTHTEQEMNPWWAVDLKAEFNVSSVSITNREDCCAKRLDGAEIRIGNSFENGGSTNPRCATITYLGAGETHNYDCKEMKGQYVTVTIPDIQILTLCEVQVFGVRVDSPGDPDISP